ncbi:hypothetical protein M440DRAFT_350673 [Trichoderma longibrachiatum ATCC 18648]|uniref:Uncharacterized protein n=1 Tax=Trichoderma longibrachiatum ATCC 18648 TaxID=983965 RepID=A0A2T4BQD8_TRILO|nr:hypothetical protein M440DRAFT_350673 [Trichoderma longibrachiatum ATCC 18648]
MIRYDVFDARDLLAFPGGDNSTDTVFGGVHFNLTTLQHWNYTYYSNGTLSNNSRCYLTYEPYEPKLLISNGTFINATKCYSAVDPIAVRGYTGIGFAVAYAIGLMLTLSCLAKHGRLYLPKEKRFYPIGRRWQWYWGCFVSACALISLFTNIDIDRYHVGGKRGLRARFEAEAEGETGGKDDGIEMASMSQRDNPRVDRAGVGSLADRYAGKSERRHNERIVESFAGVLFPNNVDPERARRIAEITADGPPPYRDDDRGRSSRQHGASNGQRNGSTDTTNSIAAPPQQVRSMLDV